MSLTFNINDTIPEPSTSVEELNTTLVKMRKVVKQAKVHTFRDMAHKVKSFRLKSSKMEKNERIKHKMEHKVSELKILRSLSVIRLCKLILNNEKNKTHLSTEGHTLTVQDRLIVRLSETKPVATFVRAFRTEHPDWRSLVHYLLYKNVSGKWKSREQKRRNRTVHGTLPLPPGPSSEVEAEGESSSSKPADNSSHHYRVEATSTLAADSSDDSCDLDSSVDSDYDMDSDAASDVAEEVISKALAARGLSDSAPSRKTKRTIQPTPSQRTKEKAKKVSAVDESVTTDKKKRKEKTKSITKLTSVEKRTKRQATLKDPSTGDQSAPEKDVKAVQSDNEDPLGSDDVEMRTKLGIKPQRDGYNAKRSDGPSFNRRPPPVPRGTGRGPREQSKGAHLHPSWQAKRDEQFKSKQWSLSQPPVAKHIVFE